MLEHDTMAGWRIGFAVGNQRLVAALARIKSYLDYGAFTPIQVAATTALNDGQQYIELTRGIYRSRRDVLVDTFDRIGWPMASPKATMFLWTRIPSEFRGVSSMEFTKILINEAQVAVAPGIGFGEYGEGYVRIGLVENENRIRQAARNIQRMINNAEPGSLTQV
jgi:alanine-synthesizing transaminase